MRKWELSDVDDLVEAGNNFNIFIGMTDRFPHPYTSEKAIDFIKMVNDENFQGKVFAIEVNEKAVGSIGIHFQIDVWRKNMEIGYWISQDFWNKGIVSKAIKIMSEYAFNNFDINRIFAKVFNFNLASQTALMKNNFIHEATLQNAIYKNGEYYNELIFSILRN